MSHKDSRGYSAHGTREQLPPKPVKPSHTPRNPFQWQDREWKQVNVPRSTVIKSLYSSLALSTNYKNCLDDPSDSSKSPRWTKFEEFKATMTTALKPHIFEILLEAFDRDEMSVFSDGIVEGMPLWLRIQAIADCIGADIYVVHNTKITPPKGPDSDRYGYNGDTVKYGFDAFVTAASELSGDAPCIALHVDKDHHFEPLFCGVWNRHRRRVEYVEENVREHLLKDLTLEDPMRRPVLDSDIASIKHWSGVTHGIRDISRHRCGVPIRRRRVGRIYLRT